MLSQAVEISLEEECALLSNREKFMAAGNIIRCTNCNRLGHTAGKCVSKVRFPPAFARAERIVMSIISCYNCGRSGHIAKECRQRLNNELRGPRGHADFADQRSHANFGRQETLLDNREPGSATRNASSVQNRNWTRSENGGSGPTSNQSFPRISRHWVVISITGMTVRNTSSTLISVRAM